jgi:TRAP-type C4-dicarboxylate transport system permease small subunit
MFKRFMLGYKWLIEWIEKGEVFIASLLLAILACVIMVEIVSRYILKHPFPWVLELSMLMITYIVFLGFPVMYKQKSLVVIEFLFNKLSLRLKRYLSLIWEVMVGIFMAFLVIATYKLQWVQRRYTSPTLDISFRFFTIPILFCSALIFFFNIYFILTHLEKDDIDRNKLI